MQRNQFALTSRTRCTASVARQMAGDSRLKRLWRNNGLSITLFALFTSSLLGQALAGWHDDNQSRIQHEQPLTGLVQYLHSGHFLEVTMENWESEFLQMFVYVVFTVFLYQRGSSESKDPDSPGVPDPMLTPDSPACARSVGWRRRLYENSMSVFFLICFLLTFLLHAVGGAAQYSEEQMLHGQAPVSLVNYLGTGRFWSESLQNWQSEFLSLFAMVIVSIFLRQRGSPESKSVSSPNSRTGR